MTGHWQITATDEAIIDQFVSDYFGIASVSVEETVRGVNRTFLIRRGESTEMYLRLYRTFGRPLTEVDAEGCILNSIVGNEEFDVCRPLADRKGRFVARLALGDGVERAAVVFSAAAGRRAQPVISDLEKVGKALRALHSQPHIVACAPRRLVPGREEIRGLHDVTALPGNVSSTAASLFSLYDELCLRCAEDVRIPTGFCHGDYRLANMNIDGDKVVLFDFDDCGVGWQWFDLATIGWWLESEAVAGAGRLWLHFVQAYDAELLEKPSFMRAIAMLIADNQLRAIHFMRTYCAVDDGTWQFVINRAMNVLEKAISGTLAIWYSDRQGPD